jgi:UPF0755 protein
MKIFGKEITPGPDLQVPSDWTEDPWDQITQVPATDPLPGTGSRLRWVVWSVLAMAVAAVLWAGYVGWDYLGKINPGISSDSPIRFTVSEQDTFETVTMRLLDEGVIVDADVFRWYVERNDGLELTPGFFLLLPGDHMGNILGRLRTPPERTFTRVTFPEGFTLQQISTRLGSVVDRMTADGFIDAATSGEIRPRFLPDGQSSLEGLLFPDTYQVSNSESEGQVIERMVAMMERVARQEDLEDRADQLGLTPYEVLIIASMIEREAKIDEDRAKISAVIRNRLQMGMLLQIDATLYYENSTEIPFSELRQIDSPYNSYMYRGLPPTPIANPGRASIRAALYPAPPPPPSDPICRNLPDPTRCSYLYYVLADERGGHAFAATAEQHEANVRAALAAGLL